MTFARKYRCDEIAAMRAMVTRAMVMRMNSTADLELSLQTYLMNGTEPRELNDWLNNEARGNANRRNLKPFGL